MNDADEPRAIWSKNTTHSSSTQSQTERKQIKTHGARVKKRKANTTHNENTKGKKIERMRAIVLAERIIAIHTFTALYNQRMQCNMNIEHIEHRGLL